MSSRSGFASLLAAAFALALVSPPAFADAIGPPPDDCPRGQVGITSHGGPQCVPVAPTDCPTGWTGALGGQCILHPCADDSGCQAGEACVEHSVCLQPVEDNFYDYGEEEREKHGELEPHPSDILRSPGLLAGPPMPRTPRSKPIFRYNAVNLCAPEVACAAPNTCQPEKLCVPKGSRALAYRGTNIGPTRVGRKTDTPLTTSASQPTEVPAVLPPPNHGCAGCATAPAPTSSWAIAAAVGALLAVVRRRRR